MTSRQRLSRGLLLLAVLVAGVAVALGAQAPSAQPDWKTVEGEALGHYQALIRKGGIRQDWGQ